MRIRTILGLLISAVIIAYFSQCKMTNSVSYEIGQDTYTSLSDYRFFTGDIKELNPNERVIPYDLNSALFSDYAQKARFVWIPDGSIIKYSEHDAFDFPKGSILIKNFYYPADFRDENSARTILETRLLIHEDKGWITLPYIWNEEQTDATLALAGGNVDISWIHYDGEEKELNYSIPDKNQCKNCHQLIDDIVPIGPKARNLNKDFRYSDGIRNQLQEWVTAEILEKDAAVMKSAKLADYSDESSTIEDRAMAYLEINCGHCHNPDGSAHTSGLNLTIFEERPANLGICKSAVSAGKGTGGFDYDILPGKADSSILLYRMISNDPSIMMPELGRKIAHEEGIEIVRQWIDQMNGSCN